MAKKASPPQPTLKSKSSKLPQSAKSVSAKLQPQTPVSRPKSSTSKSVQSPGSKVAAPKAYLGRDAGTSATKSKAKLGQHAALKVGHVKPRQGVTLPKAVTANASSPLEKPVPAGRQKTSAKPKPAVKPKTTVKIAAPAPVQSVPIKAVSRTGAAQNGAAVIAPNTAVVAKSKPAVESTRVKSTPVEPQPLASSPTKIQISRPRLNRKPIDLPPDYKPSDREPFMNELQREYFRRKLIAWKEDINRETKETLSVLHEDSTQHADLADRATSETDRALELRARDRQRKLIAKIDAAIQRTEDGSYGYCEDTSEPIGLKRLDARPIATLSIEAQERHERRERVYRDE